MNTPNINDGGPAFPCQELGSSIANTSLHGGMSLRDWFAGQALIPLVSAFVAGDLKDRDSTSTWTGADVVTSQAYTVADAMLKARQQ